MAAPRSRERIQEFVRVGVSVIFIAGAVYLLRDKWLQSFQLLRRLDLKIFTLACLLFLAINFMAAYRLRLVLQFQNLPVRLHRVVYFSFVGLFFNLFLPSSLGGDLVKIYYLSRDSGTKMRSASSVLTDRLLGLGAVISVACLTLPFFVRLYDDRHLTVMVLAVSSGFVVVVVLLLSKRLAQRFRFLIHLIPSEAGKRKMSEFYHALAECRSHLPKLTLCYFISLVIQVVFIGTGFLVSRSIGMNVSFIVFMLILPMSGIISMLPSVGGLGVREAAVIYFLSRYASPVSATAYALAFDILIYGFGLFCGILYILLDGKMKMVRATVND